jgi:hypothetical protein
MVFCFVRRYPLLLFPAYQLQEKLREKVIGKWWWDVSGRDRHAGDYIGRCTSAAAAETHLFV